MWRNTFILAPVFLLLCSGAAGAAVAFPQTYVGRAQVPAATTAPAIDGSLGGAAWKNAARFQLAYDLRDRKPAGEVTTVYLMADAAYLYVGVDAKQSAPVRATEHTDMVGLDTDDEFQIDLWPNGTSGFRYKFTSTAIGTHYEYSTENNSFEPSWQSAGKIVNGGYTITMRIPFNVMHGTGSAGWRMQLIRYEPATNIAYVWSYGPDQQGFNDVNFAGYADGLPRLAALKAKPRVGVYALGSIGAPSVGGSTSRAGADFSLPVGSGTSFVGTIHPDFSNVEVDQQTISPTAFTRIFNEVRPFFTQGANFYNYPHGTCVGCPGILELYTPNIPTPRQGYAVEGAHGLFTYGAFEAVGAGRIDTAQAINYTSPNQQNAIDVMRTSADLPGLHDDLTGFTIQHDNLKHVFEYVRYADDSGSQVADGTQAQRYEAGAAYYTPNSGIYAALRKVGKYFNPFDGIVQHPDIAGYDVNGYRDFQLNPKGTITDVTINGNVDRYHAQTGELDQTDTGVSLSVTTRSLFNVQASTGSSYLLLAPGLFAPVNQQGVQLGYNLNSNAPDWISFNTGRFGPGRLNSWNRTFSLHAGARGLITVEADDTQQFADAGPTYTQWLERLSYAYQSGANQSFALGVRRIIGTPPMLTSAPFFVDGWNLSAAFHRKVPGGEIYAVYGDAAAFSTSPQFIVKWIRYVGADKGT